MLIGGVLVDWSYSMSIHLGLFNAKVSFKIVVSDYIQYKKYLQSFTTDKHFILSCNINVLRVSVLIKFTAL